MKEGDEKVTEFLGVDVQFASDCRGEIATNAAKNLKHARVELFKGDMGLASEQARLKQHIWSYPERTPFILQWERTGPHGHVAIVERIGESLFIFQQTFRTVCGVSKSLTRNGDSVDPRFKQCRDRQVVHGGADDNDVRS